MKESFGELYSRLYDENFEELEKLRKKESKKGIMVLALFFGTFLFSVFNPFFIIVFVFGVIGLVIYLVTNSKNNDKIKSQKNTYKHIYKAKVIKPLITNVFDEALYEPSSGISRIEYNKGNFKESYDRYSSDDLVIVPLKKKEDASINITFSDVHTEIESRDSDGNTTYTTVFSGLVAFFNISKHIPNDIYIRKNGRVSKFNKDKVNMDMPDFEKLFDVESKNNIFTMRILTADVMAEMVDLYEKYKYKFEFSIIGDSIYMRIHCGYLFEPNVFGKAMNYKQMEKYYLILKALINISKHIYKTIDEIEL